MSICIVGKNSKLVRALTLKESTVIISNREVHQTDFSEFDYVFVFSWINDESKMKGLLSYIPFHKMIFVSSLAVYSLLLRTQWNPYPRLKSSIEKWVYSKGGKILRIGITSLNKKTPNFGAIPFTSNEKITEFIYSQKNQAAKCYDLYEHILTNETPPKYDNFFYRFSHFSNLKIFRVICEIAVKILPRNGLYGYTADLLSIYRGNVTVGSGVIGSAFSRKFKNNLIICSPDDDVILKQNGFFDTRVGLGLTGLKQFWHGVRIINWKEQPRKKVPLLLCRKSPTNPLKATVSSVSYDNEKFTLHLQTKKIIDAKIPTLKLVMAAGPLNNCRLLNSILHREIELSDHEIGIIGSVSRGDSIIKDLLRHVGPFVYGRAVILNEDFILDLRPHVEGKKSLTRNNLYNDTPLSIFLSLLKNFSFHRLNEALFNKLGIALSTTQYNICIQAVSRNCIKISPDNEMHRTRLDKNFWSKVIKYISERSSTFIPNPNFSTTDAQHIVGGAPVLEELIISNGIRKEALTILGSPTTYELTARHHTSELIEYLESQF